MFGTVIYIFSWVALGGGFLLYRKSKLQLQIFCWLPVTFLTVICFNALLAALMGLLHVPIGTLSLGLLNIAASIYFWHDIVKNNHRQQYTFHVLDIVFAAVLFAVVFGCTYKQFGLDFKISYLTIDPAVHLRNAMDVVNTGTVTGMFFAPLCNGMFIETFLPFLQSSFDAYKLFMIADAGMLYLSGLMLYALIRKLCKTKFLLITALVLTLVYVLGYPLNNMLYGFVYLGIGVTVTGFIVFATECFMRGDIAKNISVGMLSLGLLALMLCYLLFVPVVMLGVFVCLTVSLARAKRLLRKRTLVDYAVVFLVPILLGMVYSYGGIFGTATNVTVDSAIALEGAIYRSLIVNFVIFMPFAVYAVIKLWHGRKNAPSAAMFGLLVLFMAGMLVLGLKGDVSSYYFYKNYYLLSLFYFTLAFYGISYLAEKSIRFLCSYFGVWLLLAGVAFVNLEARINAVNPLFAQEISLNQFFDIYLYNNYYVSNGFQMDEGMYDLYQYVSEHRDEAYIPNIDSNSSRYWYEALTNQRMEDEELALFKENPSQWIETLLKDDSIRCILVFPGCEIAQPYLDQFNAMPKLYENESGFIVQKP